MKMQNKEHDFYITFYQKNVTWLVSDWDFNKLGWPNRGQDIVYILTDGRIFMDRFGETLMSTSTDNVYHDSFDSASDCLIDYLLKKMHEGKYENSLE